jgi:PAS domain S-box-containing protein
VNNSNPFNKILPSNLRSQLILAISLIIAISISLFVIDLVNRQKTLFLKINHDRGISLSENLANIATSHVVAYEIDGLQNLLVTYNKMPGLEYAMVISPDGIVLAHTNGKYLGLRPSDSVSTKLKPVNTTQVLLENNHVFDVASPIINHDQIVGWARIGLSQSYLTSNLSEIKKSGIIYIVISLIIGALLAILVAGRLSKGLQKLVTVAQKIKEGNRDLRADPSRSIEVTQVGTAINQMLDEISTNEKLLSNVLENMPVGIFILDAQGKVLSLNPEAKQIWEGAKYVNAGDYNIYKGWFPNGKEIESHEWGAAIALNENRAILNQEAEIEGFDGSRKTILNSCIPLRDTNEKITGLISINIDISERKLVENKLKERSVEIQKLSAHLENAQEEERTRIAREIHDELGQQLTGLKMDAFVVAKNIEDDKKKAADKVNEMVKLIDFAIKTVRRISSDLRPGVLDDLGLMAAIEWQGQEFEKRTGIKLVFESDLSDLNPERNLSTNVFRVYQEILTNVMRHAKASLVETKLAVNENNIILEVKDNGQGFNFEEVKNKGSLGLVGMKERVLLFNGQLGIDSKKNMGTIINLRVPLVNNKN